MSQHTASTDRDGSTVCGEDGLLYPCAEASAAITKDPFSVDLAAARAWLTHKEEGGGRDTTVAYEQGIDENWAAPAKDLDQCVKDLGWVISELRGGSTPAIHAPADATFEPDVIQDSDDYLYVVFVYLPGGVKLATAPESTRRLLDTDQHSDAGWPGLERVLAGVEAAVRAANREVNILLDHFTPREES